MTTFVYGYDPICGWCYGAAPAVRAVSVIMPVRLVMAGLVIGDRVGPAAAMEGYIQEASKRLEAVTGRRPAQPFFDWLKTDGSVAASAPPAVAVHAVMQQAPEAAVAFAHAVTEAHFEQGIDPNDPNVYKPILEKHAPDVVLPNINDDALAAAAFEEGRRFGLKSFPTFYIERDGVLKELQSEYSPRKLVEIVRETINEN